MVDKYSEKTFDTIGRDEPRIIIPMYDGEKNLIGFQGRALDKSPNKYITIMLQEDVPKIYGLEKINTKLPVYVVEGPFDSTFVNNSVALCGSDGEVGDLKETFLFLSTIMNPVIKKLSQGLDTVLKEAKESSSGKSHNRKRY